LEALAEMKYKKSDGAVKAKKVSMGLEDLMSQLKAKQSYFQKNKKAKLVEYNHNQT
jgi:hypothetical protein